MWSFGRARRCLVCLAALSLFAAGLGGCSSAPATVPVKGVLMVQGKPAAKVAIDFHPDTTKGNKGPSSRGETDEQGRFTLTYSTPEHVGQGAVPGWHKVVLSDLQLAASETGHGVPIRFGNQYGSIVTTTLEYEVKSGGPQEITVEVPTGR